MSTTEPGIQRPDALLTSAETARRLRISESALIRWRGRDTGPPFIRVGTHRVRYSAAAVDAWLAAQQNQAPTGAA